MNTLLEVQPTQEPNLLATTFQNTLVPSVTYEDVRFEAYGQTLPKEEVGGDLVDLVTAGSDVVAYVADVSGHGLLAGLLAGMVKTAVRYGVHLGQELPILLETLNHVLPTVKAPNMFATFAGLRFDGSHEVEFTTAGHVPLLQYRRRQGDVIRHSIPQLPLGLFEAPGYVSGRVRYGAGDVFLLVTDGIVEAADNTTLSLVLSGSKRFFANSKGTLCRRSSMSRWMPSHSTEYSTMTRHYCWFAHFHPAGKQTRV